MNLFKKLIKDLSSNRDTDNQRGLSIKRNSGNIAESLQIPEPTRSLLWLTDDDTEKIESATSIGVIFDGENFRKKENGYYSEPSLIWSKLPIKPNNELYQEAMYWPSYSAFSPEIRYQYLHWLGDITQPTNLSYVFLYFYGLERHMLVGDYDAAVDEIARLLKAHPKSSFRNYASRSLIVASLAKNRLDIIDRVPSLLEEEIDEALALRIIKGTSMTPDDVISIASKVGFKNKRYIKLYPEDFKKELQKNIDEFEDQFGNLMSTFNLSDFERSETEAFANLSIPEHVRRVRIPVILENTKFSRGMYNLLETAHKGVKNLISEGNIKRHSPVSPAQSTKLDMGASISDDEIDVLISNTSAESGILDLHFALLACIQEHYKKRETDDNYRKSIAYCMAQIKIQSKAADRFKEEYPGQSLPTHTGYSQLIIILQKERKYDEAIELAREAKAYGWNGDWDARIEKLSRKK